MDIDTYMYKHRKKNTVKNTEKYHTVESKLAVELDIAALDWSNIYSLPNPNMNGQTKITNILNKNCPIRYQKATKPQTPWSGKQDKQYRN